MKELLPGTKVKFKNKATSYYDKYLKIPNIHNYIFEVVKSISSGPGNITTYLLYCEDIDHITGRDYRPQFNSDTREYHTVFAEDKDFIPIKNIQESLF